jgi:hypothetical protein
MLLVVGRSGRLSSKENSLMTDDQSLSLLRAFKKPFKDKRKHLISTMLTQKIFSKIKY